jgi:hypothetical protein
MLFNDSPGRLNSRGSHLRNSLTSQKAHDMSVDYLNNIPTQEFRDDDSLFNDKSFLNSTFD